MASVPPNDSKHSAKSKPKLYNGGIKDWNDGDRIAVKSFLHSNKLLEVVLHGVAPKASPPSLDPSGTTFIGAGTKQSQFIGAGTKQSQFITPTAHQDGRRDSSTTASAGGPGHQTFKILLQDHNTMLTGRDGTKIIGPFDAATVIDMLDNGDIDKDSSLISYSPDGFWEAITPDKELEIYKSARGQARVAPLTLPAQEPEEDTVGRTEADDRDAYHLLMQIINNKVDTGRALLQQADNLFGYSQSGHEFFKWLDDRAKASVNDNGLINAEDALQDVFDFKLPEGELTKETITLKGDAFKTLWFKQPKERWGIKSDVFKAWTGKFPSEPFKGLLTQIYSLDLINPTSSVLDDFDSANRMLCALYSRWCMDHPKVVISPDNMHPRALVTKGGPKDGSWKVCFRCWETGSHLSYECTKAPKVCTRCGLDGGKGPSCGGEYDPVKCMVKGYKPHKRISDSYMEKLRAAAEKMGVKFGVPTDEKAALIVNPDMVTYKCVDGEWVPG
jgi:hypothetical protein